MSTVRMLRAALIVLIALSPAVSLGEGGSQPLVFPQRATVDLDTPVLAGESVLMVGTTEVVFAPNMGEKGKFGGYVRVGSAIAPLKGKLVCKRGKWVFKASAKDKVNNKPDLSVKLNGEIDGRTVTGSGSIKQKSTSTNVKNANLAGKLAGNFARSSIQLQFHFEPNAPADTAPTLESFVFTPDGLISAKKFKCTSRSGNGGVDNVKMDFKAKGAKVKFAGTNDGNVVDLLATGKIGPHKFKDYPVSFPNLPTARPNAFATGTGSRTITIPANGCVTAEVVITTNQGVSVTIPAGTKLRTVTGALIQGSVRIRVGDGGGARLQPGERIADGCVQVLVDLLDGSGNVRRVVIGVVGESPTPGTAAFKIDLGTAVPANAGGVLRVDRTAGDFVGDVLGDIDTAAGNAPAFEWEDVQPRVGLTYALGAERKTLIRASQHKFADQFGSAFSVNPGYSDYLGTNTYATLYAVGPFTPGSTFTEFPIPDGTNASEFPRLKRVQVTTADDGRLLGRGAAADPGVTLGESIRIVNNANEIIGVVLMQGVDGSRAVVWNSDHQNRVSLQAVFCDDLGTEFVRVLNDPRGDDGELTTTGTYTGDVRICLRAQAGYNGQTRVLIERALRNSLPDACELSQALWLPGFDGVQPDLFKWTLANFGESVRNLPAVLTAGGGDIGSLAFTYTARGITITPAPEKPVLIYGNLDGESVQFLDLATVLPLAPAIDVNGRPGFAKLNRNKCIAYVIVGKFLYIIDVKRRVITYRVKLKGNGTGLAADATGGLFYVCTDRGTFEARDAVDGHVVWQLSDLPRTFLTSIHVPHDGGRVWLSAPLTNQVFGIDTTRRQLTNTLQVVGVQSVASSHSQEWLAMTNLQAGTIVFHDLLTPGPRRIAPSGGTSPVHPVWSADDTRVYTGNQGTASVGVVDVGTFLLDSIVGTVTEPNLLGLFLDDLGGVSSFVTGAGGGEIFTDGFESGDVTSWSGSFGNGDAR